MWLLVTITNPKGRPGHKRTVLISLDHDDAWLDTLPATDGVERILEVHVGNTTWGFEFNKYEEVLAVLQTVATAKTAQATAITASRETGGVKHEW